MRAMTLIADSASGRGALRMADVEPPRPGPGELLVRVRACGVCRTDLHIIEGDLPGGIRPLIPGHQVVGTVVEVGADAGLHAVGDRVGVSWLHDTCDTCRRCRAGRENLCERARFTGFHVHGGYAEYCIADARFAHRLPDTPDDAQVAPLLCAGLIGYRALNTAAVPDGGRVGLYGFGASAHVTIQVAVARRMRVFVFSGTPEHRRLARDLGAEWCGGAEDKPPTELDGTIVFAPAGWIVPCALEHLDRGGTCALAGIHMSPIPELDYTRHLFQERRLASVTANTRADAAEFLRLAAEIPIATTVQRYSLSDAERALGDLSDGRVDGAAVLEIDE